MAGEEVTLAVVVDFLAEAVVDFLAEAPQGVGK